MHDILLLLAMIAVSLWLDATVRPHVARLRRGHGLVMHLLLLIAAFGTGLAVFGNLPVAAASATMLVAVLTIASNAKHRMLGEPLVFSDLALLGAIVRHPQFYFTAIPLRQRVMLAIGAAIVAIVLAASFTARLPLHLAGLGLLLTAGTAALLLMRSGWFDTIARVPDLAADVARHGLLTTLALYWWRWRETAAPPPLPPLGSDGIEPGAATGPEIVVPEIVVIVQCESFADPRDIAATAGAREQTHLTALSEARRVAWQWGNLEVSGFGAYTMRTEYGVLFGRDEAALGFRRYDPFLTALGETSYALPRRLHGAGYRCRFVHPHDLRFYQRDRLMPAIGFDDLIGEQAFAPPPPGAGRYVDDRTLGAMLTTLIDRATEPTLIYAVTMENHGPWDSAGAPDGDRRLESYMRHVRSSDAMLGDLMARLPRDGRPACLVFFGDHRPSIPGITAPGGERHTPYVILRFGPGSGPDASPGPGRVDLSPAGLHHAILHCIRPGGS